MKEIWIALFASHFHSLNMVMVYVDELNNTKYSFSSLYFTTIVNNEDRVFS